MTEQEAAERWCPKAKQDVPRLFGDGINSVRHDRCIGDCCMWWRWVQGFPLPNDPPAISERYHGFCGLAGKP